MNTETLHKPFIFREPYHAEKLFELYEDDYKYIEDVFLLTLFSLKSDLADLRDIQSRRDLRACQKQIHKIKPSLGYVGLERSQDHCRELEDKCKNAKTWREIQDDLGWLLMELLESSLLIEATAKALNSYNEKSNYL